MRSSGERFVFAQHVPFRFPRAAVAALAIAIFACAAGSTVAAEPEVSEAEMPRYPAVEPKDAVATMKVRPGFRVELAAAEPLVVDPIAGCFDENGRLYVIEMRDYSERRDDRLGRVRLLDDTDGDGAFDRATTFADDLAWPTAIFCWQGGVFVGSTPDVLYLKDMTGDGVADERRVVYTGFADGNAKLNVQALLNSFNWGLDNRVHGSASLSGGRVRRAGAGPADALDLRGSGFSFDPRTLEIRAENGGGQHGLSFDDAGRTYVCSNSHHIQTFAYDRRYAVADAGDYAMPRPLIDIAVDGPAAEVYRASPEEPWRVIRTKWRVSGAVRGMIEGGGRSAGYFTGATGVTIYRGDAYGPPLAGDAVIGDAGGHLVHRKKPRARRRGRTRAARPRAETRVPRQHRHVVPAGAVPQCTGRVPLRAGHVPPDDRAPLVAPAVAEEAPRPQQRQRPRPHLPRRAGEVHPPPAGAARRGPGRGTRPHARPPQRLAPRHRRPPAVRAARRSRGAVARRDVANAGGEAGGCENRRARATPRDVRG